MANNQFEGKIAVVTGGASGIGLAIVERLTKDGARVVLSDIDEEAGRIAAERLGCRFIPGDLSRRSACASLIQQTADEFGSLHILVNSAGFQHIDPIDQFSEDTWEKMLAVMLTAPFLLTRYSWPYMRQQSWGRIVNIASRLGTRAATFKSGYTAVKHGLVGLTKVTALEGGPLGITANAVCPAFVRTPLMTNQISDQARTWGVPEEEVIEKVMLGKCAIKRLIEPEEIADIVAFLCSEAGSAMTGSPLLVDLGSSIA
ncbi:MAG: 3-hydroxybutyrate dehydrogenase [Candidatus Promineifilaceae bacterium]